jgi:hypothetical protein
MRLRKQTERSGCKEKKETLDLDKKEEEIELKKSCRRVEIWLD